MKTFCNIIILLISVYSATAQYTGMEYGRLDSKRYLSVEGASVFYSNCISTKTFNSVYNDPYLSNETKESIRYDRPLKGYNEINAGMQFIWLPDTEKSKVGIYAFAGTRHIRSGNVVPDFYELVMFGNKRFAGTTADLSNSRLFLCDYQKISLGATFRLSSETGVSFASFHLSPIKGQRYIEIETASTWFYTAETGEMLSMQAQAIGFCSDQSKRRNQDFAGNGFAVGGMLYFYNNESDFWVYTSASDLGFIDWKHKSSRTYVDTLFNFTGLYIDNILSFDSSQLNLSSDTITRLLEEYTDTVHFRRSLPETFVIEAGKYLPEQRLAISGTLTYVARTGMPLPRIQLNTSWKMNDYFQPSVSFSHGGSGRLSAGLGLISQPLRELRICVYTPDILSVVLPENSYADGILLKISYIY